MIPLVSNIRNGWPGSLGTTGREQQRQLVPVSADSPVCSLRNKTWHLPGSWSRQYWLYPYELLFSSCQLSVHHSPLPFLLTLRNTFGPQPENSVVQPQLVRGQWEKRRKKVAIGRKPKDGRNPLLTSGNLCGFGVLAFFFSVLVFVFRNKTFQIALCWSKGWSHVTVTMLNYRF